MKLKTCCIWNSWILIILQIAPSSSCIRSFVQQTERWLERETDLKHCSGGKKCILDNHGHSFPKSLPRNSANLLHWRKVAVLNDTTPKALNEHYSRPEEMMIPELYQEDGLYATILGHYKKDDKVIEILSRNLTEHYGRPEEMMIPQLYRIYELNATIFGHYEILVVDNMIEILPRSPTEHYSRPEEMVIPQLYRSYELSSTILVRYEVVDNVIEILPRSPTEHCSRPEDGDSSSCHMVIHQLYRGYEFYLNPDFTRQKRKERETANQLFASTSTDTIRESNPSPMFGTIAGLLVAVGLCLILGIMLMHSKFKFSYSLTRKTKRHDRLFVIMISKSTPTSSRILFILAIALLIPSSSCIGSCFQPTEQCPETKEDWVTRSLQYNCIGDKHYTCILNDEHKLAETCSFNYTIPLNAAGCPNMRRCFDEIGPLLVPQTEFYSCPYEIKDCPPKNHSSYSLHQLYLYPACIRRNREKRVTTTSVSAETPNGIIGESDPNVDDGALIGVVAGVLIVCLGLVIIYILRLKSTKTQSENLMNTEGTTSVTLHFPL